MTEESSPFDQAADALRKAMKATDPAEQNALVDEALRLNRRAVAEEKTKLAKLGTAPPSVPDPSEDRPEP